VIRGVGTGEEASELAARGARSSPVGEAPEKKKRVPVLARIGRTKEGQALATRRWGRGKEEERALLSGEVKGPGEELTGATAKIDNLGRTNRDSKIGLKEVTEGPTLWVRKRTRGREGGGRRSLPRGLKGGTI